MQFKSKKFLSLTASIAMAMSTMAIPTFSYCEKVPAATNISSIRLGGVDRYETAVKVSQAGWQTSDYAIIATGEDFPDALCAEPLAKKYNAPILLTCKNYLNDSTKTELQRLKVKSVLIIGGNGAVSQYTEKQIQNLHISTDRILGINRYETSKKIADKIGASTQVAIATGENFPDALSIASIAAKKGMPILLTKSDSLSDEIAPYIKSAPIEKSYVVGGACVVSEKIFSQLKNPIRLGGVTRYDTNVEVLKYFSIDLNVANTFLATGDDFPDALTSSVLAASTSSPLLLICNNTLNSTKSYVNKNYPEMKTITVIGGTRVMPDGLVQRVLNNFDLTEYPKEGNTVGNINNQGLIAYQNNIIYAANSKPACIVKMNADGSDKKVLSNDKAICLNVAGDYIFYIKCIDDNNNRLYRMNSDGTNPICLNNQDSPLTLIYYNNYLYYVNQSDYNRIYRINIDGTGRTRLLNDMNDINCNYLNITDNYIYYSQFGLIVRMNKVSLDGLNKTPLSMNACSFEIVKGDYIYYINQTDSCKLYRMKTNGTENTKLCDDCCNNLNMSNDILYYCNKNDLSKVYAIKTDGTGRTKVKDVSSSNISIANNLIITSN